MQLGRRAPAAAPRAQGLYSGTEGGTAMNVCVQLKENVAPMSCRKVGVGRAAGREHRR